MTDDRDAGRSFHDEALPQLEAVYRFALSLVKDPDRAQDLVQDTYLRAYRSWDQYRLGTQVKSWLFTICRNGYLRDQERGQRREELLAAVADEDPRNISCETTVFMAAADRDPEGTFWRRVVDDEVLRAIDELPDDFRHAVLLSDLEDLTYDEIAQVLGVPVGTVKSRLFRGRRLLQEKLYEYAVSVGIISARADAIGESNKGGEG